MDDEVTKQLVQLQNKLNALESALKEHAHELYEAYQDRLESEKQEFVIPSDLPKSILDGPEE
jgi:hypothetical protein